MPEYAHTMGKNPECSFCRQVAEQRAERDRVGYAGIELTSQSGKTVKLELPKDPV